MSMKDKDTEIFKGKTLSSLLNDIYNNQLHTKSQIDLLCDELSKMIKNVSDVAVISPIIKDYLDVAVKNDDQLVKIANVVTKIITAKSEDSDDGILSEKEKEQLLDALNEEVKDIQSKSEEIKKNKSKLDNNNYLEN
jgi:tryptophanyl-tRNA synthetase